MEQSRLLDDLFWSIIPNDLVAIFKRYQRRPSSADLDTILIEWANKANQFVLDCWKLRNVDFLQWERDLGITKVEKRNYKSNRRAVREQHKHRVSGKHFLFYHIVDESLYTMIKLKYFLNFSNFLLVLDAKVI